MQELIPSEENYRQHQEEKYPFDKYVIIWDRLEIKWIVWGGYIARHSQYLDYIRPNGKMIHQWWIWKDLKGRDRDLIMVLSWNLLWRERIKQWKTPFKISGIRANIRTEYLPNIGLEHYRYANPLAILIWDRNDRIKYWNVKHLFLKITNVQQTNEYYYLVGCVHV